MMSIITNIFSRRPVDAAQAYEVVMKKVRNNQRVSNRNLADILRAIKRSPVNLTANQFYVINNYNKTLHKTLELQSSKVEPAKQAKISDALVRAYTKLPTEEREAYRILNNKKTLDNVEHVALEIQRLIKKQDSIVSDLVTETKRVLSDLEASMPLAAKTAFDLISVSNFKAFSDNTPETNAHFPACGGAADELNNSLNNKNPGKIHWTNLGKCCQDLQRAESFLKSMDNYRNHEFNLKYDNSDEKFNLMLSLHQKEMMLFAEDNLIKLPEDSGVMSTYL
ncbi:hypothetical protein ACOZB2_31385 [Pantoea endophytica]